jgi:hypothetical protein
MADLEKDPITQLSVVEMKCTAYNGSTDKNMWFVWFVDKKDNRFLQTMHTCPSSLYKVGKTYCIRYDNALSKIDRSGKTFYSIKNVSK